MAPPPSPLLPPTFHCCWNSRPTVVAKPWDFSRYILDCFFVFFRCNGTFSSWYYLAWQTISMICILKYKMTNCRSGNFQIFSLGWFGSGWVQNSINCSNWGYIEQSQVWTWNWTCWQHVKYLLDEGMCVDPFWQEGMYPC